MAAVRETFEEINLLLIKDRKGIDFGVAREQYLNKYKSNF